MRCRASTCTVPSRECHQPLHFAQIPVNRYTASHPRNVASDCSTDGKKILFASHPSQSSGGFNLYVLNTDDSSVTALRENEYWEFAATWSPDGSRIVFSSNASVNQDLYVMPADGGNATQITKTPGDESGAQWSPDGTTLLYNLNTGSSDLWMMEVDL